MTTNKKLIQLLLIFIGVFLLLATYYLYPNIQEKKYVKTKEEIKKDIKNLEVDETLKQVLIDEGFLSIEKIDQSSLEDILKIEIIDKKTAEEIKIKAKEYLTKKEDLDIDQENEVNTFTNVEYNGLYNIDNNFTVKSKSAYILKEDQDVVFMSDMKVTLFLNDGRVVIITSDEGSYNKVTYDCFFKTNVRAADSETVVLSDNLDLISSEDMASVYNNVVVTNDQGSLVADKIDYDFETKYYQVSMYNDEKVKIKIIK